MVRFLRANSIKELKGGSDIYGKLSFLFVTNPFIQRYRECCPVGEYCHVSVFEVRQTSR